MGQVSLLPSSSAGSGARGVEQGPPEAGVPGNQCPLTRGARLSPVSKASVEAEKGLQARFRAVLLWPPSTTARHPTVLLGLGLALGVVVLVLLLV